MHIGHGVAYRGPVAIRATVGTDVREPGSRVEPAHGQERERATLSRTMQNVTQELTSNLSRGDKRQQGRHSGWQQRGHRMEPHRGEDEAQCPYR
jgi:hypothetical protein